MRFSPKQRFCSYRHRQKNQATTTVQPFLSSPSSVLTTAVRARHRRDDDDDAMSMLLPTLLIRIRKFVPRIRCRRKEKSEICVLRSQGEEYIDKRERESLVFGMT